MARRNKTKNNKQKKEKPTNGGGSKKGKKQTLTEQVFAPAFVSQVTRRVARKPTGGGPTLSRPVRKYATALVDPFSPEARGAFVPSMPAHPSYKITAVSRFNATIGSAGYGWICFSPTLASNAVAAYSTTATYAGAVNIDPNPLSANNTLTTGVARQFLASLPFVVSDLAQDDATGDFQVSGRVVSSGVRVRYVGTTMNESGVIVCYVTPMHDPVIPKMSDVGTQVDAVINGVTRDPCTLNMFAVDRSETEYTSELQQANLTSSTLMYPYSGGITYINGGFTDSQNAALVGAPVGAISFTGVAGSTFFVEYIQHVEYTGVKAMASATPNVADTQGFEIVQSALSRIPMVKQTMLHSTPREQLNIALAEVAAELRPGRK